MLKQFPYVRTQRTIFPKTKILFQWSWIQHLNASSKLFLTNCLTFTLVTVRRIFNIVSCVSFYFCKWSIQLYTLCEVSFLRSSQKCSFLCIGSLFIWTSLSLCNWIHSIQCKILQISYHISDELNFISSVLRIIVAYRYVNITVNFYKKMKKKEMTWYYLWTSKLYIFQIKKKTRTYEF